MKLMFFSDIHGVPATLEKFLVHAEKLHPDKLILLGDVLYHGPRNGVPGFYDPQKVAELLNARKEQLIAVRGNCDSEVDQMMLSFPIMGEYAELLAGNARFFLTHGHLWNENHLPPVPQGTVLVHGHTHIPLLARLNCGITVFNPGSISLPKMNYSPSFGYFDGMELKILRLEDGSPLF